MLNSRSKFKTMCSFYMWFHGWASWQATRKLPTRYASSSYTIDGALVCDLTCQDNLTMLKPGITGNSKVRGFSQRNTFTLKGILREFTIADVQSLSSFIEKTGLPNVIKNLPHKLVRQAGEGRLEIKGDESGPRVL